LSGFSQANETYEDAQHHLKKKKEKRKKERKQEKRALSFPKADIDAVLRSFVE